VLCLIARSAAMASAQAPIGRIGIECTLSALRIAVDARRVWPKRVFRSIGQHHGPDLLAPAELAAGTKGLVFRDYIRKRGMSSCRRFTVAVGKSVLCATMKQARVCVLGEWNAQFTDRSRPASVK